MVPAPGLALAPLMGFIRRGSVVALVVGLVGDLVAQDFGPPQVVSATADGAFAVFAADLDGDGDDDVLSASLFDDTIAWYENRGLGVFGTPQAISTNADWALSVYAADVDGDGDLDALSASWNDDKIAWYENGGGGVFGTERVISSSTQGATAVFAADSDGDGDADVLSASAFLDEIAWHENLGGGNFGQAQVLTSMANGANSEHALDLDGDGDVDGLSASEFDNEVAWYENLGGSQFSAQQIISSQAIGAKCVWSGDLDGDGRADVLSASYLDNKIAWYRNMGAGLFAAGQTITKNLPGAQSVRVGDVDGDGDLDVLMAGTIGSGPSKQDRIAWQRNDGNGGFGLLRTISTSGRGSVAVHANDLDGDGDLDLLSAAWSDDTIHWYDNLLNPFDCNGNGIPDVDDLASGSSADCDGNGRPDECDIADDPSLDWNGDGLHDDCSGPNYCQSSAALMAVAGSPLIADNDFFLIANSLPVNAFGYFMMSETQAFVPGLGGGLGTLCLGAPIYRLARPPYGQVLNSGAGGAFQFRLDLTILPPGAGIQVGDTRNFQAWFRQPPSTDTSDGLSVLFR